MLLETCTIETLLLPVFEWAFECSQSVCRRFYYYLDYSAEILMIKNFKGSIAKDNVMDLV